MKPLYALMIALCLLASPVRAEQAAKPAAYKTAMFAGGCFWCMESEFEDKAGVIGVISGYAGGQGENPTYERVSRGSSGHLETVQVTYDPNMVSYKELLQIFWQNVDPFDAQGQFCDKGSQYRAAIFYADEKEEALAKSSVKAVEAKFGKPVATTLKPVSHFWPAEEHHQDYKKNNPTGYKFYRMGCGRDGRLDELWLEKPAAQ